MHCGPQLCTVALSLPQLDLSEMGALLEHQHFLVTKILKGVFIVRSAQCVHTIL